MQARAFTGVRPAAPRRLTVASRARVSTAVQVRAEISYVMVSRRQAL